MGEMARTLQGIRRGRDPVKEWSDDNDEEGYARETRGGIAELHRLRRRNHDKPLISVMR